MAYIKFIGKYIPTGRVDNIKRGEALGVDADFILEKVGFQSLSVRERDESSLDMALKAVQDLFAQHPEAAETPSLLIYLAQIRDTLVPHTSAQLHQVLNFTSETICFDIGHSCAGYVHALEIVDALLCSNKYQNAILVTGDSYRDIIDPQDRTTALVFGDAATASYITKSEGGLEISQTLLGSVEQTNSAAICATGGYLHHNPKMAFDLILNTVPEKVKEVTRSLTTIDSFLFHPGTHYIVKVLTKACGIEPTKAPFNAAEFGNTISSSLPLLLADELAISSRRNVLLCGFGAGLAWGVCALKGR